MSGTLPGGAGVVDAGVSDDGDIGVDGETDADAVGVVDSEGDVSRDAGKDDVGVSVKTGSDPTV